MDIIAIMQWGFQALFIDLGFCSTLIAIATFTLDNLSQIFSDFLPQYYSCIRVNKFLYLAS